MAEVWLAGSAIDEEAKELVATYHSEVATANFAFVFKDKASNSEIDAGIIATAKKVSPLYKLLSKDDLDFVIVIAKPLWDELSMTEQRAHLDSALCSCSAKTGDDGEFKEDEAGNFIFCLRQYDLQGHTEVLARYGVDAFSGVGERLKYAISKSEEDVKNEQSDTD